MLPASYGFLQRGLRTSAPVAADVTIEVPSMGDSVSEGTIAAIEKKPGACLFITYYVCFRFGGILTCATGPAIGTGAKGPAVEAALQEHSCICRVCLANKGELF